MSFFRELKRRNVYRVGIAYLAVAWLLIQIADTLVPALRLPEWIVTAVAVLLILGFPVALLLAWAFELTPEGIRREDASVPSARPRYRAGFGRRFDFAIIGVLAIALGYFVWESRLRTPSGSDAARTQAETDVTSAEPVSIAVLPFANTSPDPEQEYFSDGITEEILNRLARIDRLAVTSRTSAFAFKDRNLPIPEIAAALGVEHVLEGSVRKSGNRIRISAQLIRVDGDRHLWTDVYERNLTDIFAIHDEISTNIAAALELNLLGDGIAETRRVDPEAYDLYLHGLEIASTQTIEAGNRSAELFEQALSIDPLFVPPRAALAWKQVMWVTNGLVAREEYLPQIREHIDLGLEIDPDNAGLIGVSAQLAYIDGDFERAERLFRQALDQEPPYYNAEFWYPLVLQVRGKLDLAQQFVRETLQRDPLNVSTGLILAHMYGESGNLQASRETASRLEIVAPGNPYPVFNRGYINIVYRGDLVGGLADFEKAAQIDVGDYELHAMLAIVLVDLGLLNQADGWIEDATELAPDATTVLGAQSYRLAHGGDLQRARQISLRALIEHEHFDRWWGGFLTLRLAVDALLEQGEAMRAVELILAAEPDWAAFRDHSPQQAPHLSDNPGYYNSGAVRLTDYLPDFARALLAAGDKQGAEYVLAHHEQILTWRRDNGFVVWSTNVAELHAMRGETEPALDALQQAIDSGTVTAYVDHKLFRNRIFDSLRTEPRFRDLERRVRAELARQQALLENRQPPV